MVLRVRPTPTRFPTNSLSTPMDNTPLHLISRGCHQWARGIQGIFGYFVDVSRRHEFILLDNVGINLSSCQKSISNY